MIGKTISHYKILEKLGEGGMGVVYKAQDTKLDRIVALKFLPKHLLCDEEAKTRFVHEAKAASALNHTNITTIYEIDEVEDQCFISMEFVEGKSIKELVKEKTLSVKEILDIAIQVGEGLNAAHKKDIIHRDIKSDNIMLTDEGAVKIMDFGLAKLKGVTGLTKTGTTLGTMQYMSPEQAQGIEVDQRSDIFSFGVVLYEMITGQLPFEGEHEAAIIYSIVNETPEPLARYKADIPDELQRIVDKAMEKDRGVRYQHADDLGADLRKLRKELESEISKEKAYTTKAEPSIAVLPFTNLSADPEQEYFCDGMAEEIINALTHVESLRVVARTSAFSFRGKEIDIREIGKKLNVNTVLEGSVRKAGNRLRISAQLINVTDGYHLWSERYDREMEDVFAIQDEISLAIVEKLKVKILKGEKAKLLKRYTDDPEAYNLYLKGRYHWSKRTPEGLKKAIQHFKQVIEKDPGYALAYAGLADCYSMLEQARVLPPKEAFSKAKAAVTKALKIDETLSEAHNSLAYVRWKYDWDWVGAEREFLRAIELNPNYATGHQWYAVYLAERGRPAEAISEIKKAQELDPLLVIINIASASILICARQYDQATEQCRKALDMDPNFSLTHLPLGWIYEQKEMYEEAIKEYLKAEAFFGRSSPEEVVALREAYVVSGWRGYWQKHLDILKQKSKQSYVPASDIAWDHIRLGEKDQAFKWLQKAYQERDPMLCSLETDPVFDSLRSDPRFTELSKKVGLEK